MNIDHIHFDTRLDRMHFDGFDLRSSMQAIGESSNDKQDHPDESQRRDPSIGQGRHTNVEPREHAKAW